MVEAGDAVEEERCAGAGRHRADGVVDRSAPGEHRDEVFVAHVLAHQVDRRHREHAQDLSTVPLFEAGERRAIGEAGEKLGFLPGDMAQKVDPYLRPLYDALEDMMPPERVQKAVETRVIEIAPLAYMRGRTLADAFVILDEAQNATRAQMKMFLTRLGVNSRAVITGDKTQVDLPNREDSGLFQIERILPGIEGIAFHYLAEADVIRHRIVRDIVRAYAGDADAAK